jgi:pSer/pThr/pTyr-binding forkhead associated (FHA) protein
MDRDALVLDPGAHAITPALLGQGGGRPEAREAIATIYADSRGIWLRLREGLRGVYVNGRLVRHTAMLRAGDSLFLQGVQCVLLGREPSSTPLDRRFEARHAVLRATGGRHHGRCFPLDRACVVGRDPDCAVRIDDAAIAPRHAEIDAAGGAIRVRVASPGASITVNGHACQDAVLEPGDQLVIAGQQRFVVEASRAVEGDAVRADAGDAPRHASQGRRLPGNARRIPWLLLAALLLAGAISLLLVYGPG